MLNCEKCEISFENLRYYELHQNFCILNNDRINPKVHSCEICLKTFGSRKLMAAHKGKHFIDNKCPNCESLFSSKLSVIQHYRVCELDKENKKKWFCRKCDLYFSTRRLMQSHNKELDHKKTDNIDRTKMFQIRKCSYCNKEWETTLSGMSFHEKYCNKNANKSSFPKRPSISDERRAQLSEMMKERHRKNLADKWVNPRIKESYPEKFFRSVIENEFNDKNFTQELSIGKYWADFAWKDKMKIIEIDGSQHLRKHQIVSDKAKDEFLQSLGWSIMRISWIDLYKDTKTWIEKAKNFIDF